MAQGTTTATATARKRPGRGTTLSYDVSAPGTAVVRVRSERRGLRIDGRCRVDTAARRKRISRIRRCDRSFQLAVLRRPAVAGRNTIDFTGRLKVDGKTKRLFPGGYYVFRLTVQDAAGRESAERARRFTIAP